MKNLSFLAFGALFAISGVLAVPVPNPEPVLKIVTETRTHTRTKLIGATTTEYLDSTPTPTTTKTKKKSSSAEITTTTTTTSSSTTTTASTTTKEEEEVKKEENTPTSTTATSTSQTPIITLELPKLDRPDPTTTSEIEIEVSTPTPSKDAGSNEGDDSGKEKWTGDATYFDPGTGSCGETNGPGDFIAAISHLQFDPHTPGGNPNKNSLCGLQARCTRDGVNFITVRVTDRCPVCAYGDMDLSPGAYAAIGGTIAEGRFKISCQWV